MFEIVKYEPSMKPQWDQFVMEESVNGTFLQTKNFLDYHPEGRFEDASLLIAHKGNIAGVIPACAEEADTGKRFFSHKGSTFGGVILHPKFMNAADLNEIIQTVEEYLKGSGFCEIVLKQTPDLFSSAPNALIEYILFLNGYGSYSELSAVIDYQHYDDDILSNFHYNKRYTVKKMLENDVVFRELETRDELQQFYNLLQINLQKYHAVPIHTFDEIVEFKTARIPNIVHFYGVFYENEMQAAGMIFEFTHRNIKVAHTQTLSFDYTKKIPGVNAMEYLYYSLIAHYKACGFQKLSWGISTENKGAALNFNLIKSKESYGSIHSLNKAFYKQLT